MSTPLEVFRLHRFVHQMRYRRFLLPGGLTCFILTGVAYPQAIVLCLDLSESMNKQSGVSRPKVAHGVHEEDEFDHETASFNLLDELAEDISSDDMLEDGKPRFSDR